jgi:hypothetical protein
VVARRRRHDPLAILVAIAAAVFIAVSIGSPLYGGSAFHDSTLLRISAPWNADAPAGASTGNLCVSDTVDAASPARVAGVQDLKHGRLQTLDPYNAGGTDAAYGANAGLFSPVTLPPFLALPGWAAPGFEKLLEMVVAIGGTVLFFRRLGAHPAAGMLAGIAYAGCGFMVVWTNWQQTSVAAFLPLLFWSAERLAQERTATSGLLVGLPVTAMLLGGYPAIAGWSIYAAAAYLLMRLLQQRPRWPVLRAGVGWAVAGVVLAVGVSAFQLLPEARAVSSGDVLAVRESYATAFQHKQGLATALFSNVFGSCHAPVSFIGGNPQGNNVFVGSVALVLVLVALTGRLRAGIPRGVRAFLLIALLVTINQIYQDDIVSRLLGHLPVFSNTKPGRLRFLLGFCAAMLAGLGLDRVIASRWYPHWWRRRQSLVTAGVWLAAAAATGAVTYYVVHLGGAELVVHSPRRNVVPVLVAAALAAALILVSTRYRAARIPTVLVLVVLVVVQCAGFARSFWVREPVSAFYPVTATHRFLDANLDGQRASGDGFTLWPGTGLAYRQASVVGHAFTNSDWADLLRTLGPQTFATPTFSRLLDAPAVFTSPVLDQLALKYAVAGFDDPIAGPTRTIGAGGGEVALADGQQLDVPLGPGPVRAVAVRLAGPLSAGLPDPAPHARFAVTLTDAAGRTVASGSRPIFTGLPAGTVTIPVTYTTATGPLTAHLSLADPGQTARLTGAGGTPQLTVTADRDDGLRVVAVSDSVIYQRLRALPRIRWASTVRVVPDGEQAAALTRPLPAGTLLLDHPAPGSGRPATVRITAGDPNATRIGATVDAQGQGYLVIANAPLPGWHATLDGHRVDILTADHALQAVAVPAGRHTVTLTYTQPGQRTGIVLTLVSLGIYVLAVAAVCEQRRRRRRGSVGPGSDDQVGE